MKNVSKVIAALTLLGIIALSSCENSSAKDACYNEDLANPDAICTEDCPGVTACNGEFFCNECKANAAGYEVLK